MANSLPIKLVAPAQRALEGAGIKSLADFFKFTEKEVAELHGIGKNALHTIKEALAINGIAFAEK